MKRIVCLAAVVVCVVACRRESRTDSGDGAMAFSTDVRELSTKSVVTDVTESNFTQFNIMAYIHGQETQYFEEEQTATKQTAGRLAGYFTIPGYFYWPMESTSLDFFAYCGAGVSAEGITNEDGVASVSYTVPAQADEDLVVSSEFNCSKSDAQEVAGPSMLSQKMVFTHALVKIDTVRLNAYFDGIHNTADYTFTVSDIRIIGAANSGVLNFTSEGLEWTDPDGSADYVFHDVPSTFLGNSSCILMADATHAEQFIILPQEVRFRVTYSVAPTAGGDPVLTKTVTAKLTLETGKAYKIVFSLAGQELMHATSIINPSGWVY